MKWRLGINKGGLKVANLVGERREMREEMGMK